MTFLHFIYLVLTIPFLQELKTRNQTLTSVEEVYKHQPERIKYLFEQLDLSSSGLENVNRSLQAKDTILAAKNLLKFYQDVERSWVVTTLDPLSVEEAVSIARNLAQDRVEFNGVAGRIPRNPSGDWQWDYTGPKQDDEFGYSLNGHRYLAALLIANPSQYARLFDRIIQDWVLTHPLPPAEDSIYLVLNNVNGLDYRDIGEVQWRTLEAGRRLGAVWPQLFYGFQNAAHFSPATRLLMLSSLAEQANYLMEYHKKEHNWTTMEMNGLALTGLAFPEFKLADEWADYARDVMSREINRQVYPDGVQTELSTKTQWVALNRFESIANNFQKAGRKIANPYQKRLEEMYNFLAYSMRPDGHQPLNNDSDREDLRPRVLTAAKKFNRPDWDWIATNGQRGQLPDSTPTVTFPWAGIHVMRNGWGERAHWAFYDTGPYGTGHQHADKLHLSVAAFGKDLLVDGGRYTHQNYFSFDPTIWRGYFRSSFSHNIILVDGNGQLSGPVRDDNPLQENQDYVHQPNYDFARGEFTNGYVSVDGLAEHYRSVLYLKDQYWLVLDHFNTDRPRKLEVLWHYAPDCEVALEQGSAVSINANEGNLRITPLGNIKWQNEIISGQEKPVIQGWYSAEYGTKEPNPTVVYSAEIDESATFAWLLVPAYGSVPTVEVSFQQFDNKVSIVTTNGTEQVSILLPINQGLPVVDLSHLNEK